MTLRNSEVALAWRYNMSASNRNMHTDGKILKSYNLIIGKTNSRGNKVILDYTGRRMISHTTSAHVGYGKMHADKIMQPDGNSENGFPFQGEYEDD